MTLWSRISCASAGVALLASVACGAANEGGGAGFAGGGDDAGTTPGYDAGNPGTGGGDSSLPPEKKVEGDYQSPVATGHYVWIANPTSGRVAYVDATTIEVRTVQAGDAPTYVAAVPDPSDDVAIVMNVLSHDATLLRTSGGALSTKFFPLAADVNAWAVSGDGHWAVAWGDVTKIQNPDPTQGFQDLSVLDLTGKVAPANLAVGYRPVMIAFSGDGSRAFAVTQDGVSVVGLNGGPAPTVTANYPLSTDPNDDPTTRDVYITRDGSYALVRREGRPDITVVSLSNGALATVNLPANATDLDLSPDGSAALAVMRDASQVAVLPIPGIASDPSSFTTVNVTGETVGRGIVTDDGKSALLFTTVLPVDRLTVLSLGASPSFRDIRLYAPLLAVFPTHDASEAVVLHQLEADAGTSAKGAFSLVPIAAQLPAKIVGTDAPPKDVALSPSSDRAVVTVRDDASSTWAAYLARMPSFEVDEYPLASPPISAGIVAGAGRAWIAQSHPEGRITFIELATGQARTLTGFELGSRVVEGSQP